MASILEHSNSIAVLKDTELRYTQVNNAYLKLTGRATAEEVIGKTDRELFHGIATPEHIEEYIQNDLKALTLPPVNKSVLKNDCRATTEQHAFS